MTLSTFLARTAAAILLIWGQVGYARNDRVTLALKPALDLGQEKGKVASDIKLFFGKQAHPEATKTISTIRSERKTNAFGKSDQDACNWAFLSTIIALQDRARQLGGDAIVEMKAIHGNAPLESETEFVCGAGAIMAGVEIEGTVVKLK